jgi:hypothetical protein
MNWKVYGRKWTWAGLSHYPGILLEGMRKIMKTLITLCVPSEIRTRHLPDESQKHSRLSHHAGYDDGDKLTSS